MTGKKYREKSALVQVDKRYDAPEAFNLLKQLSTTKFDSTVDCAIRLGIDPRKTDQIVRGTVSLPNGTGQSIRVAVIAVAENARQAKEAGADIVGDDEFIASIQKGEINFDLLISTPDMMAKVGRLGKVLGPRGLMPTPKAGTVTPDVARAVREFKAGKIEFKADKQGNVHTILGKISFSAEQLQQNFQVLFDAVKKAKPSSAKGIYIRSISVSPTMGPSVALATAE